eukprot:11472754-Alexandrium_andersonii.AAC.1
MKAMDAPVVLLLPCQPPKLLHSPFKVGVIMALATGSTATVAIVIAAAAATTIAMVAVSASACSSL